MGVGRFLRRSLRGLCPVANLSAGLLRRFCLFSVVVSAGVSLVARKTFAHRPVRCCFFLLLVFSDTADLPCHWRRWVVYSVYLIFKRSP